MSDYLSLVSDYCRMTITDEFILTVLQHCKDQIKTLRQTISSLEKQGNPHSAKLRKDVETLTVNEVANSFINRLPREKMIDRVKGLYQEAKKRLREHFSYTPDDVRIVETTDDIPSALYHKGEFIFNSDLAVMNSDICRIVVIHETVPGHHYMDSYMSHHNLPLDRSFRAFVEGWALYAESFCDPSDKVLYYKSRLIRMCRAVGDIMINYLARNDEQKQHAITQTSALFETFNHWLHLDIMKEINRLLNQPGTVICYVIGEHFFFKLYKMFKLKHQKHNNVDVHLKRKFHDFVLSEGTVPFDVLITKLQLEE